jgi:hypothetical protein
MLCGAGNEFLDGLRISFGLFQHGQVCGILKPLDANDAGDVLSEPLGDRRAKISVVPAPKDQGWPVEAPHPVDSVHGFEIVVAIQLPTRKAS